MKYRKKPVVIEAIKFDSDDISKMIDAWGSEFSKALIEQQSNSHLTIHTLEGNHQAKYGDYIIK